jgi:ABC-type transport system involved in cytochrome bd biosynthesis fused ATPase/permease subunit
MENQTSALDPATLELLSKIDGFYSSHMAVLLAVISISFVIVGLIIPHLISRQQKNDFKEELKKANQNYKDELEKAKIDFREEMTESELSITAQHRAKINLLTQESKNEISNEVKRIENEFICVEHFTDAMCAHLEGAAKYTDGEIASSVQSELIAASELSFIIERYPDEIDSSITNATKALYLCKKDDFYEELETVFDDFLECFKKNDKEGKYLELIKEICHEWQVAKERTS